MDRIHSYSSPYVIGHKALDRYEARPGLYEVEVFVQAKVDGSQFSFRKLEDGTVQFRSRGADIYPESPGMFKKGVDAILEIADLLHPSWTYRGEYLSKPKHNVICYSRVPKRHVILYDIEKVPYNFMTHEEMEQEAARIGLEAVPKLFQGRIESLEQLKALLDTDDVLGGTKIEGLVIKPLGHNLYGQDKKILMGKLVREEFKEKHGKEWRSMNPTKGDVVQRIILMYKTEQRWQKAIQHLREAGEIEDSLRDIGKLFREIPQDVRKECEEEIKEMLFEHFWKDIARGVTAGLADWYKQQLEGRAFDGERGTGETDTQVEGV